jgi:hypothetical protein
MSEPPKCCCCHGNERPEKPVETGEGPIPPENDAEACSADGSCCPFKKPLIVLVVALAVCLGLGVWAIHAVREAQNAALKITCAGKMTQIALAMRNYSQKYGCFPPAYVTDKNGRPAHSWRVLLLPFLEEEKIYKAYRFDEPWDSPANRKVAEAVAKWFQCPAASHDKGDVTTDYMMVVGEHTISDGPHGRKAKEITDGLSDTIMLVEVADSQVPWNKPEDLQFATMNFRINSTKRQCISGNHPDVAVVAFCDGSARRLDEKTNPELIKAMLTIDGGETIPKEK